MALGAARRVRRVRRSAEAGLLARIRRAILAASRTALCLIIKKPNVIFNWQPTGATLNKFV